MPVVRRCGRRIGAANGQLRPGLVLRFAVAQSTQERDLGRDLRLSGECRPLWIASNVDPLDALLGRGPDGMAIPVRLHERLLKMRNKALALTTAALTAVGVAVALAAFITDLMSREVRDNRVATSAVAQVQTRQTTHGACSPAITDVRGGLEISCTPTGPVTDEAGRNQNPPAEPTADKGTIQTTGGKASPAISNIQGNVKIQAGKP